MSTTITVSPDHFIGGRRVRADGAKMAECRWLKPELVGQFEFVE
jgi:hypothetical protein